MPDPVPQSSISRAHLSERRISRRRLLAVGTAVPAAVVVAKALPGRLDTSAAPRTRPATSAVADSTPLTGPAYLFC
ncbi:MAG: hypothetical protein ACRDVE_11050 [Actinocrinis sp.]